MNITTEVKDYVIITFSKDKHYITKKQYDIISKFDGGKIVDLGHATINSSNIASMMPEIEYIKQFPKEKKYIPPNTFKEIEAKNKTPFRYKHLSTPERLNEALKIWKRQRDNNEVEIQSGGLARLIKWAEDKLITLQNDSLQS